MTTDENKQELHKGQEPATGAGTDACGRTEAAIYAGLFLLLLVLFALPTLWHTLRYYTGQETDALTQDAGGDPERIVSAGLFARDALFDLNGRVRIALGQRVSNEVIRLRNGYLTVEVPAVDPAILAQEAANTAAFAAGLSERGIPMLYVCPPEKVEEHDPYLPAGVTDHGDENVRIFFDALSAYDVSYLNMNALLREEGRSRYDFFYRTDHHWNAQGGFYAFQKIAEWLDEEAGIPVDPLVTDPASYETVVFPEAFLGSRGARVGASFGGVDDFSYLSPRFETAVFNMAEQKTGRFDEMFLNLSYAEGAHAAPYVYGNVFGHSLQNFENMLTESDATILVVMDSFGACVNPYLSLAVKKMYCVAAYTPQDVTPELIERIRPDAVIVIKCADFNFPEPAYFEYGIP